MEQDKLTIKTLREKYQYDKKLKKYSNRHYLNDVKIYSEVNTNKDVERHRNYLVNSLGYYKKVSPLVQDDIKDIETAMARYEIAVGKVLQTVDSPLVNFDYSVNDLNDLIKDLFQQQENVFNLFMRKVNQ